MKVPRRWWKLIVLISTMGVAFFFPGCRNIKDTFRRPFEEVAHKSYPINAYAYRTSITVKATPEEFIKHFAKNMSWLERHSKALQVDTGKMDPSTDMTVVGNYVDLNVKILGVYLPFKMICLRYKPETTLWWMMVLTNDSWILIKFNFYPSQEGCDIKTRVIGQYSKYLEAIAGGLQSVEALAYRAELIMKFNQSDFDPHVLEEEIFPTGLPGELHETFLQGYESSIRVDAKPKEIIRWLSDNPEIQHYLLPNLSIDGECIGANNLLFGDPEELSYCLATYHAEPSGIPAQVLGKSGWKKYNRSISNSNYFWIIVADALMKVRMDVDMKGRGSLIKLVSSVELPEAEAAEAMDLMMSISQIPARTEDILLDIKSQIEDSKVGMRTEWHGR